MNILSQLRRDYGKFFLNEESIDKDPFNQFQAWFDEALKGDFPDPNAFVLSTAGKDCKPSSRVLLLKGFDHRGFVFFTNYESRKSREIAENPKGSMLFFWDKLERQVRIEGIIEKISHEDSETYFKTRAYLSRLGAWASEQSRPLKSRFALMRKVALAAIKFPSEVPLPPHWGGYILRPEGFEFWQGRSNRLHDRFSYKLSNGNWEIWRLYP